MNFRGAYYTVEGEEPPPKSKIEKKYNLSQLAHRFVRKKRARNINRAIKRFANTARKTAAKQRNTRRRSELHAGLGRHTVHKLPTVHETNNESNKNNNK